MIRYLTIAIVFALLIPTQRTAAQNNTVGGALLGGAAMPTLPTGVSIRRVPDDTSYEGLLELIFSADHVVAWYDYGSTGPVVQLEGSWVAGPTPFEMAFRMYLHAWGTGSTCTTGGASRSRPTCST